MFQSAKGKSSSALIQWMGTTNFARIEMDEALGQQVDKVPISIAYPLVQLFFLKNLGFHNKYLLF